jgi:hypothetical protein
MKLFSIILLLFIVSCQTAPTPSNELTTSKHSTKTETFSSKEDSIKSEKWKAYKKQRKQAAELNKKGLSELSRAYTSQQSSPKFPSCEYSKVLIYSLNGNGNSSGAESVFRQRDGKLKEINPKEIKEFITLINSKKSYGNTTAACHEPRIGLVFFDKNEAPCAYLSLCLACNNIYTKPEIKLGLQPGMESGFSLKSRKKLHEIFEKWGFPDKNYSPLFDDDELYTDFLRTQGYTKLEIEEELKRSKEESIN